VVFVGSGPFLIAVAICYNRIAKYFPNIGHSILVPYYHHISGQIAYGESQ